MSNKSNEQIKVALVSGILGMGFNFAGLVLGVIIITQFNSPLINATVIISFLGTLFSWFSRVTGSNNSNG